MRENGGSVQILTKRRGWGGGRAGNEDEPRCFDGAWAGAFGTSGLAACPPQLCQRGAVTRPVVAWGMGGWGEGTGMSLVRAFASS